MKGIRLEGAALRLAANLAGTAAGRFLLRKQVEGVFGLDRLMSLPTVARMPLDNLPQVVAERTALAAAHGGALPPPDPAGFGLLGADRDWLLRRQVPHPFGPYREPLHFDAARLARLPRLFIDCVAPAYPTIATARQRARSQPGWTVIERAWGHAPMVDHPQELADLLLGFGPQAG